MCGLAGIISSGQRLTFGKAGAVLLRSLQHRGPDDSRWLILEESQVRCGGELPEDLCGEVLLVHRRLSVLDLSEAGRQPMASADGRYYIVFNG